MESSSSATERALREFCPSVGASNLAPSMGEEPVRIPKRKRTRREARSAPLRPPKYTLSTPTTAQTSAACPAPAVAAPAPPVVILMNTKSSAGGFLLVLCLVVSAFGAGAWFNGAHRTASTTTAVRGDNSTTPRTTCDRGSRCEDGRNSPRTQLGPRNTSGPTVARAISIQPGQPTERTAPLTEPESRRELGLSVPDIEPQTPEVARAAPRRSEHAPLGVQVRAVPSTAAPTVGTGEVGNERVVGPLVAEPAHETSPPLLPAELRPRMEAAARECWRDTELLHRGASLRGSARVTRGDEGISRVGQIDTAPNAPWGDARAAFATCLRARAPRERVAGTFTFPLNFGPAANAQGDAPPGV